MIRHKINLSHNGAAGGSQELQDVAMGSEQRLSHYCVTYWRGQDEHGDMRITHCLESAQVRNTVYTSGSQSVGRAPLGGGGAQELRNYFIHQTYIKKHKYYEKSKYSSIVF
jgi:hypothetical protein